MSKSIKLKNNNYIDSTGITHGRELLSTILGNKIIYDTGTNSIGSWIRYTDGTMITYRTTNQITVNVSNSWGNLYYGKINDYYIFPLAFKDIPTVLFDIVPTGNAGCFKVMYDEYIVTKEKIDGLYIARPTINTSVPVKLHIIAIGKWK